MAAMFNPLSTLRSLFQTKTHDFTTQSQLPNNPFGASPSQAANEKKGSLLNGVFDANLAGKKLRPTWDFKAACELGYESSVWVYACVSVWMSCVGSVPWVVRKHDPATDEWKRIKNHPGEKFLKAPNPFMSGGDMMERITSEEQLGGNSIWKKLYVGSKLKEFWPLEMDRIRPVPDRDKFIAQYEISSGNTKQMLSKEEVVHFMLPNPKDIFWGLSPMKSIEKVLECDLAALDWWVNGIYSGCRKDGVLSFKHDLTQEQFDNVVNNVRQQLINVSGNRFPLILGHETEYTDYSMSPQEFDFTQSRAAMRNEIIAAFHMPPPLVGDLDKSSYNNLTIARRIFWIDQVLPFLERIKGVLNRSLLPDFVSKGDIDNYTFDYDISGVEALAEDFTVKLQQAKMMFEMGVPLNVICKLFEFDLQDVEGGDLGYVLNNYVPIGYINKNFIPVDSLEQLMELEMSERQKALANPPQHPVVMTEQIADPSAVPPKPPVAASKTPQVVTGTKAPTKPSKPAQATTGAKRPNPDLPAAKKANFDLLMERMGELQASVTAQLQQEWESKMESERG